MQVEKLAQNEKGKRVASKFCDHRIGNLKLSDPRRRSVRICSAVQAHGSIRLAVASCLPETLRLPALCSDSICSCVPGKICTLLNDPDDRWLLGCCK